ncbi:PQQ-binding-like beta-propeller repeat protein [Halomicrobium sp. IBSBa]|uniref:outer membrane protein assembly factor BamB family protein n=1 Tax=Halomicrobium sp. IBSBa TaxID=2778916 RepID=UPI001ABF30B3|nr:PQQ-binding-like beta-propeller repeat protein [Halomicrobium sp. IBSBa]MBO4248367.1 PQQ-binding-like beta-propeller repeat protein [Halomicrobium sp. IBSBa]
MSDSHTDSIALGSWLNERYDTSGWQRLIRQCGTVVAAVLIVLAGVPVGPLSGSVGTAAAADDGTPVVITGGGDGNLKLITANNETVKWTYSRPNNLGSVRDSEIGDGAVYATFADEVHKVDVTDGTKMWNYTGHEYRIRALDIGPDGYVYSGSQDNELHKIDPSDGSTVWTYSYGSTVEAVETAASGHIYVAGGSGEVHKVNPDGTNEWTYTGDSNQVLSMAVDSGNAVYYGSYKGYIRKLDPSSGSKVWEYNGHSNDVNGLGVTDSGNLLSAAEDSEVHKIDPSGPSRIWTYTHSGWLRDVSSGSSGDVYASDIDGYIVRVDGDAGSQVWERNAVRIRAYTVSAGTATIPSTVSGTVTDDDGDPLKNATISATSGQSTKTDASGAYSLQLSPGEYTLSVSKSGYADASRSMTVGGSSASGVDFTLYESGTYEQRFVLDDQTTDRRFSDDPKLIVWRPSPPSTTTTFNHNDSAFVRLQDGQRYNLTVIDGLAYYERVGFEANRSQPRETLVVGARENQTTPTPTPTIPERLQVRFEELEDESDGQEVVVRSPEPVTEVNYTIINETDDPVYNDTQEFEEPREYYEGELDEIISTNGTELSEDARLRYSGEFANGSAFNGTVPFETFESSGFLGGPTGAAGSEGGGSTGGLVILAGGALIVAYRYRDRLTTAAGRIAGKITN